MLLDTSAVIELFRNPAGSKRFERIVAAIGEEEAYVSIIQLAEVADWASRIKAPPGSRVEAVKEIARIVPLSEQICVDAAGIKHEQRQAGRSDFGMVDGIVLATARSIGQRLISLDEAFAGESDCVIVS